MKRDFEPVTATTPGSTPLGKVIPPTDAAKGGSLPPRYLEPWRDAFLDLASPCLRPGARILDLGAGRAPFIRPELRPDGCHYVGLDISESELEMAGEGSYDKAVAADVTVLQPGLIEQFDLVLSWQVLEHVKSLGSALANIRQYLRPGGMFVASLSGKYAYFALMGRFVPTTAARFGLERIVRRNRPNTEVFPAQYDGCYYSALRETLSGGWQEVNVLPKFRGASYLRNSRLLQAAYLRYENWAFAHDHPNLATHYFIQATR